MLFWGIRKMQFRLRFIFNAWRRLLFLSFSLCSSWICVLVDYFTSFIYFILSACCFNWSRAPITARRSLYFKDGYFNIWKKRSWHDELTWVRVSLLILIQRDFNAFPFSYVLRLFIFLLIFLVLSLNYVSWPHFPALLFCLPLWSCMGTIRLLLSLQ